VRKAENRAESGKLDKQWKEVQTLGGWSKEFGEAVHSVTA